MLLEYPETLRGGEATLLNGRKSELRSLCGACTENKP